MKRPTGGYTFIEVMIVFAITMLIFISAMVLLNGQQNGTQFNTSMQDINSKLKSYASQINSALAPEYQKSTCKVVNSKPQIVPSGSTTPSEACIYMGIALQVVPNQSKIYAYPVMGTRTEWVNGADTGEPVTNALQANLTPAVDPAGKFLFVDDYSLLYGVKVKSSTITDTLDVSHANWNLGGLFSSLSGESTGAAQGAPSILAIGYPFSGPIQSAALKDCIAQLPPCDKSQRIKQWSLCVESADSSQTAIITISSLPSGLATSLIFKSC